MKKISIILFLIFIHSSSYAGNWSKTDEVLFSTFTTTMVVDCLQTNYIFTHDNYKEKNSIIRNGVQSIGRGFIPLFFGSCVFGSWWLLDKYPDKGRKFVLIAFISIKAAVIINNKNKGIGLNFKF